MASDLISEKVSDEPYRISAALVNEMSLRQASSRATIGNGFLLGSRFNITLAHKDNSWEYSFPASEEVGVYGVLKRDGVAIW